MFARTPRYLLIIVLLLAGVALTWGQRLSSNARLAAQESTSSDGPGEVTVNDAGLLPQYIYFLDVEGWYRITPYETVVRSHYDLTADNTEAVAAALPSALGEWKQVGADEKIADDPAVVFYLNQPTVALQRTYQDPSGQNLTLTLLGNSGEDSFLLFSHTPETCYPGRLWQVVENRRESALLDDQPMHAQYLLTQHAETGSKLMVLYWYLWDDPQRESKAGVLSVRVNLFIPSGQSEEAVLERAWEFVRLLYPSTVPWDRF